MAQILIVYHTQKGNTKAMAEAVAEGAAGIERARVFLKRAFDTTVDDIIECDGLVICSPEYFGYMAGAIKDLFDRTYESLQGHTGIFRKPYSIVVSAGNAGEGAVKQIERICLGYQLKKIHSPIIAKGPVTEEVLTCCTELGKILAAGCEEGIF